MVTARTRRIPLRQISHDTSLHTKILLASATAILVSVLTWGANQILRSYDRQFSELEKHIDQDKLHLADTQRRVTDHEAAPFHPGIPDEIAQIRIEHSELRGQVLTLSDRLTTHLEQDPRPDPWTGAAAKEQRDDTRRSMRELQDRFEEGIKDNERRLREYTNLRIEQECTKYQLKQNHGA